MVRLLEVCASPALEEEFVVGKPPRMNKFVLVHPGLTVVCSDSERVLQGTADILLSVSSEV